MNKQYVLTQVNQITKEGEVLVGFREFPDDDEIIKFIEDINIEQRELFIKNHEVQIGNLFYKLHECEVR